MTPDLATQIADTVAERIMAALPEAVAKLASDIAGVHTAEAHRPLVDIHAIAQSFGVSVVTVRRMVAKGMPVVWVASAMRFDVDACRAWNAEHGKQSVTKEPAERKRDEPVAGVTLKQRRR